MAIKPDFDAIFDNLTSVNVKKFLMSLGFIAICTSAFATIQYYTSCGTFGYSVGKDSFPTESEFLDYVQDINIAECGEKGVITYFEVKNP